MKVHIYLYFDFYVLFHCLIGNGQMRATIESRRKKIKSTEKQGKKTTQHNINLIQTKHTFLQSQYKRIGINKIRKSNKLQQ